MKSNIYEAQIIAGAIQQEIKNSEERLIQTVEYIEIMATKSAIDADCALVSARACVEKVRNFVSDPTKILGNVTTKHGEVAEHIQVEIGNGQRIMEGLSPNASIDVGRTAPEDYLVDGIKVQSKFINSPKKTLEAIIEHSQKYPFFTQEEGYYHCPKDYYEVLVKIAKGERVEGLKDSTVRIIQEKIQLIETETGKSFFEIVKPGISTYDEVQLGRVGHTLDKYEEEFVQQCADRQRSINNERKEVLNEAQHITDPSWIEATKFAILSAAIQGLSAATIKVYQKIKGGKNISEFSIEDWKDIGYDFTVNGTKGGISGVAIYVMTKVGRLSAPFAGAITSSTIGTAELLFAYKKSEISLDDFADCLCALNVEAGLVAVGSAIGQCAIPIPALGAIVGMAVTKSAVMVTKHIMGEQERALCEKLQAMYNQTISALDEKYQEIWCAIEEYYKELGGLINAAMNKNVNRRLEGSVKLCKILNVLDPLSNTHELDVFMEK